MTHHDDQRLVRALREARDAGRRCALATIVSTRGSTPRKVGARMLVDPEGGLVGTVGGGCGEAEVIEVAHRVARSGAAARVQVDLTEDLLSWSPAVCGGVMDVFVEALHSPDTGGDPLRRPAPDRVLIHYRRPPDREDVFEQAVVVEEDGVVVTFAETAPVAAPIVVDGDVILEPGSPVVWFTFPGAWHDIGRFHRADGTFTGFYANVLTPPRMAGGVWHTTDLFLDVWLPVDGGVRILDEDELEEARASGWIDEPSWTRARAEAERLVRAAEQDRWPPEITRAWTLEAVRARLDG